MEKRRLSIIAIVLILSIGNYSRIKGTEHIRLIEFLSIFIIGALSALLIYSLVNYFKNRN